MPKKIGDKTFPAGCVVDLFEPEALALIESGEGAAVPDGTMARKKAYGIPGCVPPAGFEAAIKVDNTPKSAIKDAIAEIEKQKTNTKK